MNRGDIALLGPRARAQIEAEIKAPAPAVRGDHSLPARRAPGPKVMLACCADGCEFEPTASVAAMERHADSVGHHRYRILLGTESGDSGGAE